MLDLAGQTLDEKYLIDRRLGAGGMGAVYLATHLGTKRPVALKVIAPQFMSNSEFVERFRREAEAAGRLRHPNVVNVTDFGFARYGTEQLAYLVMEYLDGCTLGNMLREQRPMPLAFIVDIVEQVCLAIDKAHQQGIIHRDLKPDNIWLEPNGRGGYNVKVLDFGLAKLRDTTPSTQRPSVAVSASAPAPTIPSSDSKPATGLTPAESQQREDASLAPTLVEASPSDDRLITLPLDERITGEVRVLDTQPAGALTQAGAVLGTPHYMSPEQCLGETLGASSDLYSLGIITYQMLTGETPFKGATSGALLAQHIHDAPPSIIEKRSDIPKSVAAVVMSALSKNPAARPSDAIAFATSLKTNAAGESALIRQGISIYAENFSTFIYISAFGLTPATVGVAALFTSVLIPSLRTPLSVSCVALMFLFGVFLSNLVIGGVVVPIVAQLQSAPLRPVQLRPILASLKARIYPHLTTSVMAHTSFIFIVLPIVFYTAIPPNTRAYLNEAWVFWMIVPLWLLTAAWLLKRDQIAGKWLYAPVVLMEEQAGRNALNRSKILVDRLGGSIGNIFPLFTFTVIGAAIFAATLNWLLLKQLHNGMSYVETFTIVVTAVLSLLFGLSLNLLLNPLIAIEIALFYLKARQIGGEKIDEVSRAAPSA